MQNEDSSVLNELLDIILSSVRTKNYTAVIGRIIKLAASTCAAEAGFFYNCNDDKFLNLEYSFNNKLNFDRIGSDNNIYSQGLYLPESRSKETKSAAEISALNNEVINLPAIYNVPELDNSFFANYDSLNNYNSIALLSFPLTNSKGYVIGVVQLINPKDAKGKNISFTKDMIEYIQEICGLAVLILENRKLSEDYGQLLESFIEVLARAIDAKSPYTGAHCQRVPVIARMLATAAVQEENGPLKDFEMSNDDWYALNIASWLHDCGKVTTPEYIVDKATKLETIYNRIHEIRCRFEILRRDAHIDYLKKRLANTASVETLQAEFVAKVKELEDEFALIARCNTGDTPLSDDDIKAMERISQKRFIRYFSRLKGISWAERDHISDKNAADNPGYENLLQNREDHLSEQYNRGELYNLKVRNGTINKEEREKINEHIVVTIDMLKALPFPKELANVVEYAGAHHERVDGKGYPNGLTGDQMSVPAKIMAIADIFEALTANDRPYKEPKKLSQVLTIMREMKNNGHIDPDLYEVFIRSGIYKDYAGQYIDPSQIDDIIPEDYL